MRRLVSRAIVLGGLVLAGRAEADRVISVDPDPITFWSQASMYAGGVPGEPQSSSVFLTNTGTTALTVTGMAITGPDASLMTFEFPPCEHTTSCPDTFTMAPGEQRGFALQCVAPAPGTFTASLAIASDATSGTSTVPMSCLGLHPPQLEISPPGLDFGTSHSCWYGDVCGPTCETRPLIQTLTLTNTAPEPSELDVLLALPPSAPGDAFTITVDGYPTGGEVGWVLLAGQSVDITFAFHPWFGREQFFDGPLIIETMYPQGRPVIQLPFHAYGGWGIPVVDTPPQLGIVPFGETLTATIAMHNAGTSCLDLREVSGWRDLTIVSPLPADRLLAAGETFHWTVACTPSPETPGGELQFYTPHEGNDNVQIFPFYCHSPTGALYASPSQVSFTGSAEVGVGMSGTQQVQVANLGSEATDLVGMTSSDARFTAALASGGLPITLAPGDQVAVDVTFTPAEVGHATATLLLHGTNGTDFTVALTGDGVHLEAAVTPSAHDYGPVDVPGLQVQRFELSNLGERRVTIDAVTLDRPADYHVDGLDAGMVIEPGGTVGFTVRATPSLLGRRPAVLAIDLDRARDLAIPLGAIGRDPAMTVTTGDAAPADYALELGSVDVDVTPRLGHVTLHNAGGAAISLATCAITGDPAFTLASACPPAIAAGGDADLAVAFAPTAESEAVATLAVTGGFATGALQLDLHGDGQDQHVELSATRIGFPDTFRHPATPETQVVTLRNTAIRALALTAITVEGAGFTRIEPATATLAPGDSVAITVGFAPPAIGELSGTLVVGNADDPQIARIALTGRGIARDLAIAPLAIALGAVPVGATRRLGDLQPDAIAIRNADTAATFTISEVRLSGDPAFRLIGPDRTTLAPGERARLDIELTPTAPGTLAAEITVFADGDPEPIGRITVTANAVPSGDRSTCGCRTVAPADLLPLALAVVLIVLRPRRRALSASASRRGTAA